MTVPCDAEKDLMAAFAAVRAYALSLPEAWEDFPWGESAFKVRKKVFLFAHTGTEGQISFTMKLPTSAEFALLYPFTEKTGYGLGASGWVTSRFGPGDSVPTDLIMEWTAQSYRAIAPKGLALAVPDPRTEEDPLA